MEATDGIAELDIHKPVMKLFVSQFGEPLDVRRGRIVSPPSDLGAKSQFPWDPGPWVS